jgi:hypothetical protein
MTFDRLTKVLKSELFMATKKKAGKKQVKKKVKKTTRKAGK